jgi:hypothetical protein
LRERRMNGGRLFVNCRIDGIEKVIMKMSIRKTLCGPAIHPKIKTYLISKKIKRNREGKRVKPLMITGLVTCLWKTASEVSILITLGMYHSSYQQRKKKDSIRKNYHRKRKRMKKKKKQKGN